MPILEQVLFQPLDFTSGDFSDNFREAAAGTRRVVRTVHRFEPTTREAARSRLVVLMGIAGAIWCLQKRPLFQRPPNPFQRWPKLADDGTLSFPFLGRVRFAL
jgi:hypothetical protein